MDAIQLNRIALPAAALLTVALSFLWPIVRLYRRTGVFAVTSPRSLAGPERIAYAAITVLFVSLAIWVATYALLGPSRMGLWNLPALFSAIGWAFAASGLALLVVAQAQMGASWRIGIDRAPTALVSTGLYRFVRNPIYSGMFLVGAGLLLIAPCPFTATAWILAAVAIAAQARLEERHLLAVHGAAFLAYASRVGRFVPGIGRLPAKAG